MKRAGTGLYKGLCPFHAEKTPSFTVNTQKQLFYCFGCHAGGDAFRFVQLAEGKSFPEAVADLASRAGIPLPPESWASAEESRELQRRRH